MSNPLENQPSDSNNDVTDVEPARGVGNSAVSSEQAPQQYCCEGCLSLFRRIQVLVCGTHISHPRRSVYVNDRNTRLELYEAAKNGKWKAARRILDNDRDIFIRADLTKRMETILHVATQANQGDFVRCLLAYLDEDQLRGYLESRDVNNNTAFLFAVASGNMEIVEMMGEHNTELRTTTGYLPDFTPLHVAALHGKSKIADHLYGKTKDQFDYGYDGLKSLLFLCVEAGIYDLALKLLNDQQEPRRLALARDPANETILHILSRQPSGLKQTQQHELVKYLWNDIFLELPLQEILENIRGPTHVAFNAVEVGNFQFLKMLLSTYPYLIWEVDERGRSIIHIAVLNRKADIFKFTHDIGSIKDIIVLYKDNHDQSNLLHMAATWPLKDQLLGFGPAFQMTLELLWFEAVKNIVPPSFIEMKNTVGLTPQEAFTENHAELVNEAQSWTKKTTNCCMVVSTLIITGSFAAAFSIPGGIDDKTGIPNYLVDKKMQFMIFSIFDAVAMISSSTSMFMFFSILISRHAELDFQYESLPRKLMLGLIALLISITSMMISFSGAFIMYFNTKTQSHGSHHNGLNWVPTLISGLTFIPILLFFYHIWPLYCDMAKLIKFSRNLPQPR